MEAIRRKSYHSINKVYFFTATIHKWMPLLADENNKQLIIDYLCKLSISLGSWHTKQRAATHKKVISLNSQATK